MVAFPRNLSADFYLMGAGLVLGFLTVALWRTHIFPMLDRVRILGTRLNTMGSAIMIAGVFVFLRSIRQFIYFQF